MNTARAHFLLGSVVLLLASSAAARSRGAECQDPPAAPAKGAVLDCSDCLLSWELWWRHHRNAYLGRPAVAGAPAKRSIAPVLSALQRAIATTDDPEVATECALAMAQTDVDQPDHLLVDALRPLLRRRDENVAGFAALSIGIAGRLANGEAQLLVDLLTDRPAGRAACGGSLDEDVRAFAAYGLGLLVDRTGDGATQRLACDALTATLAEPRTASPVLLAAAAHGLGLAAAAATPCAAAARHDAANALMRVLAHGDDPSLHLAQGRCLLALARFAAHDPVVDAALKARCQDELLDQGRRMASHVDVERAAILVLAERCAPDEDGTGPDAALSALLLELRHRHGDAQARRFATLALGRIGGARNRAHLLAALPAATAPRERSWVALALGVLAHRQRRAQRIDQYDGDLLLGAALAEQFAAARNEELVGALGVALGLAGPRGSAATMRQRLHDAVDDETTAIHLVDGLVLLDDREAIWPLRSVVARSRTRPCLRAAATEALARLGDATAATAAAVRMAPQPGERVSLVESVLAVRAAGHLGAPACIDPLLAVLADDSQEGLVRACAAAALGHAIDQRPTPWTVRVALGADYRALDRILSNGRNGILDRF
jgi:hypothetical protein